MSNIFLIACKKPILLIDVTSIQKSLSACLHISLRPKSLKREVAVPLTSGECRRSLDVSLKLIFCVAVGMTHLEPSLLNGHE